MKTKAAAVHTAWKNRIVGEAVVTASELKGNPKNWRTHSAAQRGAIDGILDTVGWVQRVIVNRQTGLIVDGHARVEQAATRGEKVPVVYVELTEGEEALVLATLDPIGAMAGVNRETLNSFVKEIAEVESVDLAKLLCASTLPSNQTEPIGPLQYRVIVDCHSEKNQLDLLTRFTEEGFTCRALIS